MPKGRNHKGRSTTRGQFVQLTHHILRSAAWQSLSPAAVSVYLALRYRYNGRNNGSIVLSVRDAAEWSNINKDTAGRALRMLVDRGLIECVTLGGFTRKVRHATEWRLLDVRCDVTGALPSRAFQQWRPQRNVVPE
jgi:hypothetical protein